MAMAMCTHPNPLIRTIDKYDKYYSAKIHNMNVPWYIEFIILPFALIFNRLYCFIGGFAATFMAYYNPEISNMKPDIDGSIHSAIIFFFYMVIYVFATLFCTQTIKKLTKRIRPQNY